MIFERIKSAGLAHNSYLIGSEGEAAVIDPRRDCDVYIELAEREEQRIRYVFETHRNEDYVIGSGELSNLTGAEVFHGPGLNWGYGSTLHDGEAFRIGSLKITALQTPGHTDESMSYALADLSSGENAVMVMVFTGDALFVGDVGRTDFYGPDEAERLAGALYDSIVEKILPLGDGVILCPAHGAGSVCGGSISERDYSTIGIERSSNPMLQLNRQEFIRHKTAEYHERPSYFRVMERYNLEGPPLLGRLPVPPPLTPAEFNDSMERDWAIVVDARTPPSFGGAHIRGSYSIWLEGLPAYGALVLPYNEPILLVLELHDHLKRAVRYLVRLGYENIRGYLRGGIEAWYDAGYPVEYMGLSTVHELKRRIDRGDDFLVLDVRDEDEWRDGHIEGAMHIYVGQLESRLSEVPRDRPITVVCNVGHRASLAASILMRAGYTNVCCDVLGSMKAWSVSDFPIEKEIGG
ncbi:MAG: MBL fold metallo-hydrolase [Euryarchaeota archaeon]|nr:MAG: Thiosulfate sulfurtransferase GlpE [ANME-2 cluster archaeon]MEA1865712.1 MBL fold metallo-hydrolase [Euryarchaeota archaeon]